MDQFDELTSNLDTWITGWKKTLERMPLNPISAVQQPESRPSLGASFEASIKFFPFKEEEVPPIVVQKPAPVCPTSGTVMVVFSGIATCGCSEVSGPSGTSVNITAFSGLNGAHTLTWDGSSAFVLSGVGSYTLTAYSDLVCGTFDSAISGSFNISAVCSGGTWEVTVSDPGLGNTFLSTTPEPMGIPIANSAVCSGGAIHLLIGGGTATVS